MADPASGPPAALRDALRALVAWLETTGTPGMVIGGFAVAVLARARATQDIDAVVWLGQGTPEAFLAAAGAHGIAPRVDDALGFARRSGVLLLRHTPSGVPLDVSLGALPFEEAAIRAARPMEVGGVQVPLPRPEDLVVTKAVAGRDVDRADITALLEAFPALDRARVRRVVAEFATVLDAPEILQQLDRSFAAVPPGP